MGGGSQIEWNHKLNGIYNRTLFVICTLYSEEFLVHALQRNAEVSEKVCVNIIYLSCFGILGDCGYSMLGRGNFVALFLEGIMV